MQGLMDEMVWTYPLKTVGAQTTSTVIHTHYTIKAPARLVLMTSLLFRLLGGGAQTFGSVDWRARLVVQ